jgi:hypothetical protein
MKRAIHIIFVGEMRNAYNFSAGKPDWKRPLGGRCGTWEDNIKMATKETGYCPYFDALFCSTMRSKRITVCMERFVKFHS